MGIEKITGNGAVSYQGGLTKPAAVEADTFTQSLGAAEVSSGAYASPQDFSLETDKTEKSERAEELRPQGTQLKSAVSDLNKQMKNSEAIFGIHEKTNRVTIKIVDKSTKEVIREYPPEETLDMIAKVWEIAGILVDEKM